MTRRVNKPIRRIVPLVDDESKEIWREIPGWPGYEVSDYGRVRSWRARGPSDERRRLHPSLLAMYATAGPGRYVTVHVRRPGSKAPQLVHRLVLLAFIGPPSEGQECRHLDGDNTNNRVSNLAWGSRQENIADQGRHGTRSKHQRPQGEEHVDAKLTESDVREIRSSKESHAALARRFGVVPQSIANVRTRLTWSHLP